MGEFYRVLRLVRTGLVLVKHPAYGEQNWRLGKVRGNTRVCANCDDMLVDGTPCWRPNTHAGNRTDRLCVVCVPKLLGENLEKPK